MQENHYLVPVQLKGEEKNLEYTITATDIDDAEDLFVDAKEKLWNVNKWGHTGVVALVKFSLTDSKGHLLNRKARKGDHIRIGNKSGDTVLDEHDWFTVDALEYDDYPDDNKETFALHLRPVNSPLIPSDVALATDSATCTLVVERDHKLLKAIYHGRNETAHLEYTDIENGNEAWLGFTDDEWIGLLQGFVS